MKFAIAAIVLLTTALPAVAQHAAGASTAPTIGDAGLVVLASAVGFAGGWVLKRRKNK